MGWTGELRDDATGLTYLRSRDYSPGGGRFLQRDTVSPNSPGTQGYNPYAYAAGNPATHTDPSGHSVGGASTTTMGMILGVIDMTVVIEAIVTLFKPARDLLRIANTLPPVIRALVNALLGFVIMIFINTLVMLLIGAVMEIVGQIVGKTLVGSALVLIRFMKVFNESFKLFRLCRSPGGLGFACRHFDEWFPRLPNLLNNPCVRAFLNQVGEGLADAYSASDFSAEQGAEVLGWATFACFRLKVPVHNGKVAALINGRPEVDMRGGSYAKTTPAGIPRDKDYFWSEWKKLMPEALSDDNLRKIAGGDSPIVDETWIRAFPEDAQYMGQVIDHHHHLQGHLAIPLPWKAHRGKGNYNANHPWVNGG